MPFLRFRECQISTVKCQNKVSDEVASKYDPNLLMYWRITKSCKIMMNFWTSRKDDFLPQRGLPTKYGQFYNFWIWPLINVSGPKFNNKLVFDTLKIIWELYDGKIWKLKSPKMAVFTKNIFSFPAILGGGVEWNLTIRHSYENLRKDVLYECQTCSIVILYEIYIAPNRPFFGGPTTQKNRKKGRFSMIVNF